MCPCSPCRLRARAEGGGGRQEEGEGGQSVEMETGVRGGGDRGWGRG